MEDIPGISPTLTWLLTQGVLGFTTAVGFAVAALLYRARERDRLGLQASLDARDAKHDVEVASWTKLYTDLQNQNLSDQKLYIEKLANANDLIRQMWTAGGQNAKAS